MGKDRLDRSHEHERNSTHEHRLAATKAHWAYHVNFDSTVFSPLWVLFHHLVGTGKRRESGGTLPPVSWISFVCRIDTNLHLGIFIIINQSVPGLASSSCRQASLSSASYHVITTFTNLRIDLLFVYRRYTSKEQKRNSGYSAGSDPVSISYRPSLSSGFFCTYDSTKSLYTHASHESQ